MDKADIARQIQRHAGISETVAANALECVLELLKSTLKEGEPIVIAGFGKFTVRNKVPRTGHNFQTGEAVMISARRVVTFHPSLRLRTEVNSVPAERQEAGTLLPKGKG